MHDVELASVRVEPVDLKGEGLIVRLLADLVRVGADRADSLLDDAVAKLGRFACADRCYIFQFVPGRRFSNTHEWVAPGISAEIDNMQNVPLSVLDPCMPDFDADTPVHIVDVRRWAQGHEMQHMLMEQGIKAILLVPFRNEDGQATGFVGFDNTRESVPFDEALVALLKAAADVIGTTLQRLSISAEKQHAQDELLLGARRLNGLFDAIPVLIFELDKDRRYTGLAMGRAEDMLVPMDQRKGRWIHDVLPPEIAEIAARGVDVAETGKTSEPERYEVTRRGQTLWHEMCVAPVGFPGSDDFRSIIIVRDVTEDERARSNIEMMSLVARMMTNLVILTETDGRVIWANPAFINKSGYAIEEMKGLPLINFTRSSNSDPETSSEIMRSMAQERPYSGQILNATRHGEEYWVDLNISFRRESVSGRKIVIHVATDITKQKTVQTELAHYKSLLESAIAALPDAFAYFDADDKLVICNERYRDFYPKTAPIIEPGVTFEDLIRYGVAHGEYATANGQEEDWIADRLDRHRNPGVPLEQSLSDGRWLQILEQPTADGGRVGMRVDITALKRAEERLGGIIDGAQVGTWEWVRGVDEVLVNERYCTILGRPMDELYRAPVQRFISLVVDKDRERVAQAMQDLVTGESNTFSSEFCMRHQDGHAVWVETRGRVVSYSADGRPLRVSGVQMDISGRKAVELALKQANSDLTEALAQRDAAERRFFDIADLSTDWFFELDAGLRHTYLSENFSKLTGIANIQFLGRHLGQLRDLSGVLRGDNARWPELTAALSDKGLVEPYFFEAKARDGTSRWLRLAMTPMAAADGTVTGWRGVGTDVSELYNERLNALQANEAKSRFLANMSHEIRTPLNGVLGMAELLAPSLKDERQKMMISTIHSSGELLLSLLNNILDMSKIEAGQLELVPAPFAMEQLATETRKVWGSLCAAKGISFNLTMNGAVDRGRSGDLQRLRQILQNLLSNAVKFTSEGTVSLHVSAEPEAPVILEVRDSGIGMTDSQIAVVFEPFKQAETTTSARFGGTGLGLSVVRELVGLMDGRIDVQSTPGVGTVFRVTLPLPEVPLPSETADSVDDLSTDDAAALLAGCRLLLADDSDTNLFVARSMIEHADCRLAEAHNGAEAVAAFEAALDGPEENRFDLILLDIAMPVMDGFEAIRRIREIEATRSLPPTPVIAFTANAMAHQIADYIVAGFDSYLAKPFRRATLMDVMAPFLISQSKADRDEE